MTTSAGSSTVSRVLIGVFLLAAVIAIAWWFLEDRNTWPRGEALGAVLRPIVVGKNSEQALVARAIWENYLETRSNASRWSGVYSGMP
jgi:GH35 family endo-1,4-beta-xylanase